MSQPKDRRRFGVHCFDFPVEAYGSNANAIVFTLYWTEGDRWEGRLMPWRYVSEMVKFRKTP